MNYSREKLRQSLLEAVYVIAFPIIFFFFFFFNFSKKRELDFINFILFFLLQYIPRISVQIPRIPTQIPRILPHSPHSSYSHPNSPHSHLHSPQSHPDSLHSHPPFPSFHLFRSRFPIPAFTDKRKCCNVKKML